MNDAIRFLFGRLFFVTTKISQKREEASLSYIPPNEIGGWVRER